MENAQEGNTKLAELNKAVTPSAAEISTGIPVPQSMPDPEPYAMHNTPYIIVGGVAIG